VAWEVVAIIKTSSAPSVEDKESPGPSQGTPSGSGFDLLSVCPFSQEGASGGR